MRTTIHDNIANIERDHLVPDWAAGTAEDGYIAGKPAIPMAQIQADYTQSNSNSLDFIKNKPTIITNNQVIGIMTSII